MSDVILTVIVPIYKGEKYVCVVEKMVREALLIAGIFDKSELIFINDYPKEHINSNSSWYRVYNNEKNIGIHASRIKGLENALGQFIHFLDQDDVISKSFYKEQLKVIGNKDIAVANAILENDKGSFLEYRNCFEWMLVRRPLMYGLIGSRIVSPGQCIVRFKSIPLMWTKKAIKKNGADDLMLWLAMFAEGRKIKLNKKTLYKHSHTGSNLSLEEDKMLESMKEMSKRLIDVYPNYIPVRIQKRRTEFMNGQRSGMMFYSIDKIRKIVRIFRRSKGNS